MPWLDLLLLYKTFHFYVVVGKCSTTEMHLQHFYGIKIQTWGGGAYEHVEGGGWLQVFPSTIFFLMFGEHLSKSGACPWPDWQARDVQDPSICSPAPREQACTIASSSFMDLNSGPHAGTACSLSPEPSSQSSVRAYLSVITYTCLRAESPPHQCHKS